MSSMSGPWCTWVFPPPPPAPPILKAIVAFWNAMSVLGGNALGFWRTDRSAIIHHQAATASSTRVVVLFPPFPLRSHLRYSFLSPFSSQSLLPKDCLLPEQSAPSPLHLSASRLTPWAVS